MAVGGTACHPTANKLKPITCGYVMVAVDCGG
jgi:hypothetical protein